jgi:hypothetical protein
MVDGQHEPRRAPLEPPGGPPFTSDVAEVFGARNGKIESFDVSFDASPFLR